MKTVLRCLLAGMTMAASLGASAQFPDRPITLIVPWAAGGSTDQSSRALAKAAERYLEQPIVVVNKPGASTTIGMAELARAKPDGYTIGTLSSSSYLLAAGGRQLPYDPIKDFTYISYYGDNLIGVAVMSESKWKSLADLIADGKAQPGKIKYGTAAVGSTQHLTTEALQRATGAKFTHIPQKGSAGSMPSLLGNHVDFITETSVWAPFVEQKQVRLLAVTAPTRAPDYPDVPTFAELGFPTVRSIQAIIGPDGIPEPVRAKLEQAFRKALDDEGFRNVMKRLSMQIVDMPGPEVRKLVEAEFKRAHELVEATK
ncbi:MAG TPA: tripartite tricarboxylate transporter substrate binding protein [Burkholderiaceae bacterium]|jgi:tripartite-type tricarboxylate transporter receptor subunit TctC|nr:tripartite tricarboxylate transporter substrate binding protein [Burkholderiaceae bacterium]